MNITAVHIGSEVALLRAANAHPRGVQEAIGVEFGNWWGPLGQASLRLLILAIVARLLLAVLRRVVGRLDDVRLREQLFFFIPKAMFLVGIVCGLAVAGVDVSGMAAVMATVGFTGAVIFTSVGQNLVAGAMIRIDDVYRVGEAVTIGGLHGTVVYKTMLRTELVLPDGSKAWVPNSSFQDGQVLNHSRLGGWRVCVQVPLDRSTDRAIAHQIMTRVMNQLSWNCANRPAFVAFDHVGGEAMFFNAYAWIIDRTQEPWYRGLLLSELVDALEAGGVSVGQTTNYSLAASRREIDLP